MITRRSLLTAAGAAALVGTPAIAARAEAAARPAAPRIGRSDNGWDIDPSRIATHHIPGTGTSVDLHEDAAAILLHVARRWHYEIAPLDTGQGGGITGHVPNPRNPTAGYASNYLSGTALCLHPTAYPAGGSETLWPYQRAIVRDILADCEGTVLWGADLRPVKVSHFHLAAPPGSTAAARLTRRLDTAHHLPDRARTAGRVTDPAQPERRAKALGLERVQSP
ncbi:hypothetical protein [Embleya sp. NPDC001921]